MELEGQIVEMIYQNEVNSYTIANLETDTEIYTVVGYLPFITIGDTLKLTGKFVTHQEYGRQFRIDTFEKMMPQTLAALEKYLANGTIKGIGPATAKKIIDAFGEDTIHVFKFEPQKLAQIKGITLNKAEEMGQSFNENWDLWQIVKFLEKFNIAANSAKKVYESLGSEAIQRIEEDPYCLTDIVRGVDFKQVDRMAIDMGMSLNNEKRIRSGIKYSLMLVSYNGHTCVLLENLITFVIQLLGVTTEEIDASIIELKVQKEIIIEERENGEKWVYLEPFYKAEYNIAERIKILQNAKNIKRLSKIEKELRIVEKNSDIELSEKQKDAIKLVNENNVCIITGGPGTGKTTVIKSIIDIYEGKDKKVVLCAPTGRAAKRMSETTGKEAKTLHRLLEIGKLKDDSLIELTDIDVVPIDADVIIVDEVSMVDLFLMNYFIKGIYLGTKVIFVGDVDQLPSVGPGSVLKDFIDSEKIETIKLDKIFRQAAKSKIILNAHNVNQGLPFMSSKEEKGLLEDFFFIQETNQEKMLAQVISLCKGRLEKFGNYEFFQNIQVISPTKKGMLGTKELNRFLQEALNPKTEKKKEKVNLSAIYREGDRIMQTKNNYDMFWEKRIGEYETGSGVFNGELGRIEKIDEIEKQVKIKFDDDKICWYTYQDLDQIEHAYAITIHKAQGSEFDVVIIPVTMGAPMLLTRNLLYTAVTRAKKLLIIVGGSNVIEFMLKNVDIKKRNTGLGFKLLNM